MTGEAVSGTGWLVWRAMVGATLEGAVRRVDGAGALNRGNAGLVVTGSIRDGSALESVGSPAIGLGAALAQSYKTGLIWLGLTVSVSGIPVSPEDDIVADRDWSVMIARTNRTTVPAEEPPGLASAEEEDLDRLRAPSG